MWNLTNSDPIWTANPYQSASLVNGYPFTYQPEVWGFGAELMPSNMSVGHHLNGDCQKIGKKRRRSNNPSQRKAANIRERRRMLSLNESFDRLRTQVIILNGQFYIY